MTGTWTGQVPERQGRAREKMLPLEVDGQALAGTRASLIGPRSAISVRLW